ncbi:hypothetical protein VT99_11041 [Candidatus Electrothrix marina]|jgi:lysyl-tRNA synthetase class II|uniref:Uncharacterized protein n=1 Tax=Candidatus Electrothrix marina TaxID=1859130 RepID=A0A3S3UC16_9BACT|nr:hypothetical protein [Desulfobulbus sp. US4]RWX48382.1 hypothetical protein VT99_11041 [Candidatus Electrothrix marina]
MSQVRNEEKNSVHLKSSSLSNIQMELIKLYSTDLDHDELMELKELLVSHFSQKAINEAGNIWAKKKLSEKTMDDWLNEEYVNSARCRKTQSVIEWSAT